MGMNSRMCQDRQHQRQLHVEHRQRNPLQADHRLRLQQSSVLIHCHRRTALRPLQVRHVLWLESRRFQTRCYRVWLFDLKQMSDELVTSHVLNLPASISSRDGNRSAMVTSVDR